MTARVLTASLALTISLTTHQIHAGTHAVTSGHTRHAAMVQDTVHTWPVHMWQGHGALTEAPAHTPDPTHTA